MKSAGRIALAAAAATTLVSGTAAALDAVHGDTVQVADSQADPNAAAKAKLNATLDRLDARAADLERQLKKADRSLSAAERRLLAARAAAARSAAVQAAQAAQVSVAPSTSGGDDSEHRKPAAVTNDDAPATHTTTGASGASGEDGEDDGGELDD
jgi:hypothetical protein